ncbi:proteoglycan 3-like [Mantella aurantiaca]
MHRLLLLLLLGLVYAQEPDCVQNEGGEPIVPSSQENENDIPHDLMDQEESDDLEDMEEIELNDHKLETCHNTSLESHPEATCRYRLYTSVRTFTLAQSFCRHKRGNLCSIQNVCVNNQLRRLVQNSRQQLAWIGVWKPFFRKYCNVDGSSLSYANFDCKQRKCLGKWCVALQVSTGKWISVSCKRKLPFICRL